MTTIRKPTGFGDRVREARQRANLSQEELAYRAGVRGQTIYRYELGRLTPSGPTVLRIAQALGVSTDWLLSGRKAATGT